MNSVAKGNKFEKKCFDFVKQHLDKGGFGISADCCNIYRQKGYPSRKRDGKEILFDISIEVIPPNTENYSVLFLFECKNYKHSVSVEKVESFLHKVEQVGIANTKAFFISNSDLQESALAVLKSHGAGLIKVIDDKFQTIFYRKNKYSALYASTTAQILEDRQEFTQGDKTSFNIPFLSYKDIEYTVEELFKSISIPPGTLHIRSTIDAFLTKLQQVYGIKLKYTLEKDILGKADIPSKTIYLNKNLINSNRSRFIFLHELGHLVLHKSVKIKNKIYKNFKDSEYSFSQEKHLLNNPKNWIEWQANCFAECALLRVDYILRAVESYQKLYQMRNLGVVYVDDQEINKFIFKNMLRQLSDTFKTTNRVVEYRLTRLGILKDDRAELTHISRYLRAPIDF